MLLGFFNPGCGFRTLLHMLYVKHFARYSSIVRPASMNIEIIDRDCSSDYYCGFARSLSAPVALP